ncbi:lactate utilization protein [Christensenellaceae bacterium OttesenSCG-928-K19]|nr:lactate utilization protein [Christensenellaceae bacterium OttesenSCG-928-K19]
MNEYQELIDTFNEKGFDANFFEDSGAARDYVMELIAGAGTVGIGGSQTLKDTGIFDAIAQSGKTLYASALERQKENPDMADMMQKATFADCYVTSSNAITKEGDFINIDATGNRVAPMFFGPKHTIIVCGINKITDNAHKAIARIKQEAVPKNAQRLGLATPCAVKGKCENCNSPQRICRIVVRIQYPTRVTNIHLVLINEELGY